MDTSLATQPSAFTRVQKLLALIPGLQYPSPEAELLESMGAAHIEKVIEAVSKKQSTWDARHGHTLEDLEWFGKFLTAFYPTSQNHDDFTLRSIVLLGAVVSPAMNTFVPAYEKSTGNAADLSKMVTELNHKLMTYWDCYPEDDDYIIQELHLEHEPRRAYAVGAFLWTLVNDAAALPLNVADDIHLRGIGMQCHVFDENAAKELFSYGELLYPFFQRFAESDMIPLYDSEMEDDFPSLSFSVPDARGHSGNGEDGEEVWAIGGESFDLSCAVLLDRVARNEGLEDASCLSAFKLAQLMYEDKPAISRSVLTLLAEWDEAHNKVLLELATGLNAEQRETVLLTYEMVAKTPRDFPSEVNMWRCLHAIRTAPLMTDVKSFLNLTDELDVINPVAYSMPDVWQDEYTSEIEMASRGALLKYVIESSGQELPSPADPETVLWMGEHADELLRHVKTIREHGCFDRVLMESILANSTLGDGVL